MPRIEPVEPEALAALGLSERFPDLAGLDGRRPEALLATVAHAGGIAGAWLEYSGELLTAGSLPPAMRELAVLRVAWRLRSRYIWGGHATIGAGNGLTPEQMAAVADDVDHALDRADEAVVRACDDLIDHRTMSDETWTALTSDSGLSAGSIIELMMVVANYQLVAWFDASFSLERDPSLPALPGTPGTPA